jgi:NAD(P)-dependent dehydrogenase (short-subunit alcohol dehydrogenase family)
MGEVAMSELTGKVALITGGGSGIGLAVARLFLDAGARVAITGRTEEKLRRAAEELAGGDNLLAHAADVTDPGQVEKLVAAVNAKFGPIDILVNNAGANIKERAFRELTPETWRQMVSANLDGAFYCTHAVLPQLAGRPGGLIVNINSVSGKRAGPLGGSAYVAAKFGLRGLALAVAAEEKATGVRISSIYPGEVDTPILEQRPRPVSDEHRRKVLRPEDVARAVLFLATLPERAWVPELVIAPSNVQYI